MRISKSKTRSIIICCVISCLCMQTQSMEADQIDKTIMFESFKPQYDNITINSSTDNILSFINEKKNKINEYRLYFPAVWFKDFVRWTSLAENTTNTILEIEINLHHIAGDGIHMAKMYTDFNYFNKVKSIKNTYNKYDNYTTQNDLFKDEKFLSDFKEISYTFDLFTKYLTLNRDLTQFSTYPKNVERNTSKYRNERKLWYRDNSTRGAHSSDYDQTYIGDDWSM